MRIIHKSYTPVIHRYCILIIRSLLIKLFFNEYRKSKRVIRVYTRENEAIRYMRYYSNTSIIHPMWKEDYKTQEHLLYFTRYPALIDFHDKSKSYLKSHRDKSNCVENGRETSLLISFLILFSRRIACFDFLTDICVYIIDIRSVHAQRVKSIVAGRYLSGAKCFLRYTQTGR